MSTIKVSVWILVMAIMVTGCAVKKNTAEEQIAQQYDPNKDIQVIQIKPSHGLVGDAIGSVFSVFRSN